MADMTAAQWATLVIQDAGAPVTQNNINNMLAWMASENAWPPPRNNPLNNGLGSGGGSGLGSYPSLEVAAQYAAKGIHGGITGAAGIGQALQSDAPFSTFHQATISATWSGDHYAGTEWLGATSPSTMGVSGAAAPSGMSTADWQALYQAGQQGGTAYLEALNAQSKTGGATGAATGGVTGSSGGTGDEQETIPGIGTVNATSQQAGALDTIRGDLQSFGFTAAQTDSLTNWAWGEITSGTDATQIGLDLLSRPEFTQQFPFFQQVNQSLTSQGQQALSPSTYMQLQQNYLQNAQAGGLPAGMVTQKDVATLIEGNVSPNEFTDRVNSAMAYVLSSPATQQAFNQYFAPFYAQSGEMTPGQGPLTLGQMAAIVMNPQTAEPLIQQQLTTAQIGGAAVTSGVGALDAATATELAKAGITPAQATSTFQNLAPLSALETARPGMGGEAAQGTVSAEQIATGNLLGNPQAQRQQQTAVEVAKAPFAGGGGYASTSKGAGVGSANPNGAPGQ